MIYNTFRTINLLKTQFYKNLHHVKIVCHEKRVKLELVVIIRGNTLEDHKNVCIWV